MDYQLTKDQKVLRKEVIAFAKEHLNDKKYYEKFSYDMWREVADFGLLGLTVDEKYGGLGESYETAAVIFEALGYACHNNGFIFVINNQQTHRFAMPASREHIHGAHLLRAVAFCLKHLQIPCKGGRVAGNVHHS